MGAVGAGCAADWGAGVGSGGRLHYLHEPVDVLFERIERRGMENPPIRRQQVVRWAESFQVPTVEEMALFDEPSGEL